MGEERKVGERNEYDRSSLMETDAGMDPMRLFLSLLDEAERTGQPDHNAMMLSTVGSMSISCRVVLLRQADERGFVFYTNYTAPQPLYPTKKRTCLASFGAAESIALSWS